MALLTRALWWIVPAYLLGAAAYELALAAGGRTDDRGGVVLAALFAMLAGAGLALMSISVATPVWPIVALAPSGAAFTLARFYTYDDYYAPQLRRYADNGSVQPAWMFVLVVAAVVAGVLAWRLPRIGAVVTAAVLVALVGTTAVMASH
jgi:hypothetical protein